MHAFRNTVVNTGVQGAGSPSTPVFQQVQRDITQYLTLSTRGSHGGLLSRIWGDIRKLLVSGWDEFSVPGLAGPFWV